MKSKFSFWEISIFLYFFHCAMCSSEEPITEFESWNSGGHFSHPSHGEDTPKVVSKFVKDGVTYQYVVSGRESSVVRKLLPDSSYEELYFMGAGRSFSMHQVPQTYLVDVYESQDELAVLVLAGQRYVLMKAVKNYQVPPNGLYSFDLPSAVQQIWKPVFWAAFVPDGLLMTDLHGSAERKLQGVELNSTSSAKFTFKANESGEKPEVNVYAFSDSEVTKNGEVVEETFYDASIDEKDENGYRIHTSARSELFVSEREVLDELEAMSDRGLLEDLEPFFVQNSIGPNLLEIFSSFSNQTRVEALLKRIEGLR